MLLNLAEQILELALPHRAIRHCREDKKKFVPAGTGFVRLKT